MIELLIMILIGIISILMGHSIWKKRMYMLISSVLYSKVKDEDMEKYATLIGIALALFGVGIIIAGTMEFIFHTLYGFVILFFFLLSALILLIIAQYKYNN